ncbi:MAG: pilus assembly protein PilP [Candidatus Competibacterales bacterium]
MRTIQLAVGAACGTDRGAVAPFNAALLGCCLLLGGCDLLAPQDDRRELELWVETIKATSRGQEPEPLPEIKDYVPFEYTAEVDKDPFAVAAIFKVVESEGIEGAASLPVPVSGIAPDPDRPREELEKYTLGSLRMVGTMQGIDDTNTFALIQAPDGVVHRITEGNYLGVNHGQIQRVSEERIDLREIVPDDATGGWKERDASISLIQ